MGNQQLGQNPGNTNLDLNRVKDVAIEAARLGREVLLKHYGNLKHIEKKEKAGLVSEADKESERVISEHLKKNFPEVEFLGEESHFAGTTLKWTPAGDTARWILDPLDGTTNYIHQLPVWCISLALEWKGKIQVAVIDVPMMQETFYAVRGQGAHLISHNDFKKPISEMTATKIQVSSTDDFEEAFLATGFVAEHEHIIAEQLGVFSKIIRECRGVRRAGAAAYDLAMVAKGVFDGYWERNIQPWDAAAGILLVEEAGGAVSTYRGADYHPYKNSIAVGNKKVQKELVGYLQKHCAAETE